MKKLAETTLDHVSRINAAEMIVDFNTKASAILDEKKKIEKSFRPLSFRAKFKTMATSVLWGVTLVPAVFGALAATASEAVFKRSSKLWNVINMPINLNNKMREARADKDEARTALLDKCDSVFGAAARAEYGVFLPLVRANNLFPKGNLSAAFGPESSQAKAVDFAFALARDKANRTLSRI